MEERLERTKSKRRRAEKTDCDGEQGETMR